MNQTKPENTYKICLSHGVCLRVMLSRKSRLEVHKMPLPKNLEGEEPFQRLASMSCYKELSIHALTCRQQK